MKFTNPFLNTGNVLYPWIISSLATESVWFTFWFFGGGGPSVDLISPSLFVRPPGSPFARRGAEPHHHHHQRSRCLCVSARAVRTRVPCYPTTMNSDINMYLGREKTGIMRKRALLLRKGCSFEITRWVDIWGRGFYVGSGHFESTASSGYRMVGL